MQIPSIHVGCGKFSLQRLEVLIRGNQFAPVACVDVDLENAKSRLSSIKENTYKDLSNRVYTTITEAKEKHDAKVCFIFASFKAHHKLVIESLNLGMHTFCVKPIARNQKEFKDIMNIHNLNPKLMLLQGYNNQWNEAALKMRRWMQSDRGIGKMLGGECICWGRQNVKNNQPQEVTNEGMFFHSLACHQLSQLVAAKGLPDYVTAYVHNRVDTDLNYRGVFGTSGGQCLFEYPDGVPFSYTGTRAAHANPFGFASRWSGQWIIHGENGDIRREGGRITLYQNGSPVEDYYLKDLDVNLVEDEQIQFKAFYDALTTEKDRKWLQQSSLDTWILMEACNESARRNEKISIQKLKKFFYGK
jgi:predicted dehydrogenase